MGRNLGYGGTNARMLRNQLRSLDSEAERLLALVEDGDTLPEWVLSKITVALDRVTVARQYVESKLRAMKKNPRKSIKTELVTPDRIQFRGFNREKIRAIRPLIPVVLKEAQKQVGVRGKFPSPICAMTQEEIYDSAKIVDKAHPHGAGHGLYYINFQLVKINKHMEPIDLLANVLHENIHHLDPDLSEVAVRKLTGDIMKKCTGIRTYGQPFGSSQLPVRANFKDTSKGAIDSKGLYIPPKYLKGLKGKKKQARIGEIGKRRQEYRRILGRSDRKPTKAELEYVFRPFETDKGVKKRPSSYTVEAERRGIVGDNADKARKAYRYYLKKRATPAEIQKLEKILKKVYGKGIAAWASGGHRPGANQFNWGAARVNSFLVGGKTFHTADAKLAKTLPKNLYNAIKSQSFLR